MVEYNYSVSVDFNNIIDLTTLDNEITSDIGITKTLEGIVEEGDSVKILFDQSLDSGDLTSLTNLIANHTPVPQDLSFIYDAIVDIDGTGDYETLSEAVASGATTIFIRSGIYKETSDIVLPNNFHLVGEDKTSTIISFGMTPSGFVIDGENPVESSGTVSITNSTNIVTGFGTTFTNLSPNDYIRLGKTYHNIGSIESDFSLTIKNLYRGPTISDKMYKATTLITGTISDLSISHSSGNLVTLNKTINVSINNIGLGMGVNGYNIMDSVQVSIDTGVVYNCSKGIDLSNSDHINLTKLVIKNNSINGIKVNTCSNIVIDGLNVSNSGEDGIKILNGDENIQIMDTALVYNSGNGLNTESNGSSDIQSCTMSHNLISGIKTSGSGYHLIGGCVISDSGGSGIDLSNTCVVTGCLFFRNLSGINLKGVFECNIIGSLIKNNYGNGIEFDVSTSECIINSCQIKNNDGFGIDINGTDNVITSCIIRNNTVGELVDNGVNTLQSNNLIN